MADAEILADVLFDTWALGLPHDRILTVDMVAELSWTLEYLALDQSPEMALALSVLRQGSVNAVLTLLEQRMRAQPNDARPWFARAAIFGPFNSELAHASRREGLARDERRALSWASFEDRSDPASRLEVLDKLRQLADAGDPIARVLSPWKDGRALFFRADYAAAEPLLRAAVDKARSAEAWAVLASASADLGSTIDALGRMDDAILALEAAAREAEERKAWRGLLKILALLQLITNAAQPEDYFERAERNALQALRGSEALGHPRLIGDALVALAAYTAPHDERVRHLSRAVEKYASVGAKPFQMEAELKLGDVLNEAERYGEAAAAFERSADVAQTLDRIPHCIEALVRQSAALGRSGEAERAADAADKAAGQAVDRMDKSHKLALPALIAKVQANVDLRQFDVAQRHVRNALQTWAKDDVRWRGPLVTRLGEIQERMGDVTAACGHYKDAIAIYQLVELPDAGREIEALRQRRTALGCAE